MDFMKKAVENKREKAREDAQEILREMEEMERVDYDSDDAAPNPPLEEVLHLLCLLYLLSVTLLHRHSILLYLTILYSILLYCTLLYSVVLLSSPGFEGTAGRGHSRGGCALRPTEQPEKERGGHEPGKR